MTTSRRPHYDDESLGPSVSVGVAAADAEDAGRSFPCLFASSDTLRMRAISFR